MFKTVTKVLGSVVETIGNVVKGVIKFVIKYWRPIVAAAAAIISYGYASSWAAGLMTYTNASGTAAYASATAATVGANATIASAAVTGAVGGAAAGAAGGLVMTGSIEGALKGALTGAVGGAISGGIVGYFSDGWSIARVAAHGVGSGVSSEIGGGRFGKGFLMGAVVGSVQWGFKQMSTVTDNLKKLAVESPHNSLDSPVLITNDYGTVDTTGGRGWDMRFMKDGNYVRSWLGDQFGMKPEGWLDQFDSGFNRYVNWTSKVHDFFNSWRYTDHGLFQPFQSQIAAELFEVYNFVGMPVAGAYTFVAKFGSELIIVNPTIQNGSNSERW